LLYGHALHGRLLVCCPKKHGLLCMKLRKSASVLFWRYNVT